MTAARNVSEWGESSGKIVGWDSLDETNVIFIFPMWSHINNGQHDFVSCVTDGNKSWILQSESISTIVACDEERWWIIVEDFNDVSIFSEEIFDVSKSLSVSPCTSNCWFSSDVDQIKKAFDAVIAYIVLYWAKPHFPIGPFAL